MCCCSCRRLGWAIGIYWIADSYATLFDLSKQLKLFANLLWCLDQQQTIVSFMSSVASMFNSTIELVDLYVVLTYNPDELYHVQFEWETAQQLFI